jgi:regulator of protease activity HflC (stomatin/prohibitin superfamily)
MSKDSDPPLISGSAIFGIGLTFALLVGGGFYGCPKYNVYSAEMAGKAELAQADQNRQILVAQAKAKQEAAEFDAQSEITRAKGLAAANKIIADGLAGPGGEAYLRYLWLQNMGEHTDKTVVYVPTQSMLPEFLESGRTAAAPK